MSAAGTGGRPGTSVGARLAAVVLGAAALLTVAAAPALAHGDVALADGWLELAPGASTTVDGELHYHRVVAAVRADGPLVVELVHADTGEVAARVGPGRRLDLNTLVRCCEDTPWAPHRLVVTNPGPAPVAATVRARLVHDDLAVMVDGAESGTRLSIVLLGAAWAGLLWRAVHRRSHDVPVWRAVRRLAAAAVAVLALVAWGAWRYGTGGPAGLLAGASDLPLLPFNPVASRATLLLVVGMVAWGRAGIAWARVPDPSGPTWWATGAALLVAVAVVAVAVSTAYGKPGAAVGSAVAAALPVVAVPPLRRAATGAVDASVPAPAR